jgi:hypothetical protein
MDARTSEQKRQGLWRAGGSPIPVDGVRISLRRGLLLLAGHVDLDELDRWIRIGWERRRGSTIPYGPLN